MRILRTTLAAVGLAAAFMVVLTVSALAQTAPDTTIDIPWGNDISAVLGWLPAVAGTVLLGLLIKMLPAPIQAFFTQQRTNQVEQLLERGLGFIANQLADKLKGQTLSVDVKNQLLAGAGQYAVDHGSEALLQWMGVENTANARDPVLAQKIAARILTSPAVNAAIGGASVGVGVNPVSK